MVDFQLGLAWMGALTRIPYDDVRGRATLEGKVRFRFQYSTPFAQGAIHLLVIYVCLVQCLILWACVGSNDRRRRTRT